MEGVILYLEDTMNFIKCVIRYVEMSQRLQRVELQLIVFVRRRTWECQTFHVLNLIWIRVNSDNLSLEVDSV